MHQGRLGDHDRAGMAHSAFYLFAVGGTIGLVSLALPGSPARDADASVALALALYAFAAIALIGFTRLPVWSYQLLSVAGTGVVTAGLYYGGDGAQLFALFYFWVILYAGYFFAPWEAALQIVLVVAAYSGLSATGRPSAPTPLAWLVTTATLLVAGCLILLMRRRLATVFDRLLVSHAEVEERAAQQESVAGLGQRALVEEELGGVLDAAVQCIADTLRVNHVGVFELVPGAAELRMSAGIGCSRDVGTEASLPTGSLTQAGATLRSGEPVIVDDIRTDRRFEAAGLLTTGEIAGSLMVAVPIEDRPFGVMGVFSTTPRRFTAGDAVFLRSVASVVAAAVRRSHSNRLQTRQQAVLELIARGAGLPATLDELEALVTDLAPAAGCRIVLHETVLERGELPAVATSAELPPAPVSANGHGGGKAGCSLPISARDGRRLGSLELELHEARVPSPAELLVAELASQLAGIAIERYVDERSLRARETEARTTSERLQALIEASPAAIIELDAEERVRLWNPAAELLFGWRSDEVSSRPLRIVTEESVEAHRRLVRQAYTTGGATGEVRYAGRDWLVDAAVSLAPLHNAAGDSTGLLAVLVDVGERNRLAEELRQAQKLEAIGRLAGGVAHDFNNILLAIKSQVWLLLDSLGNEDERRELAEAIGDAAERAAALTRQLLAFSRKQVLEPKVIDLNRSVAAVEEMLRPLIGEAIELVTELRASRAQVLADPTQIEQVLVNLAVNARDAMPSGGTLLIETRDLQNAQGDREVVLIVSDTGVGMAPEEQRRIFEPFFSTKEVGKGTGLGLATVDGIVSQSGGRIEVASQEGVGTTFSVFLPAAEAEEELQGAEPSPPATRGHETVLLVEDEEIVRAPVTAVLESQGYRVLSAATGDEAIALAKVESIDLVVTDVIMPKMSGPELADVLRAGRPDLRVLYVSGYLASSLDTVTRLRAGARGATEFLRKPFSPEALALKIRTMLDARADAETAVLAQDLQPI